MATENGWDQGDQVVGRRAALRGAAVMAGAAGLGAAAVAGAGSASAAPGDPVTQGAANDAGRARTSLTSTAGTTLALSNGATGAPLRVDAITALNLPDTTVAGEHRSIDLFGAGFVYPVFTHVTGTGPASPGARGLLFSDVWALQPIPVIPQRVLNTTTEAGRAGVIDQDGKFDSAGRLLAGKSITLSLLGFVVAGGAVLGNLTAVGSLAPGYLTMYPADPRPGTSSVNYAKGQTIANFTFTGITVSATNITVKIFASATTHVVFDVTGFAVGSRLVINSSILHATAASPATARLSPTALPAWARQQFTGR